MSWSLQLFIIAILIGINGLLAMSEIALVSVKKNRLRQLAEDDNSRAKVALELLKSPSEFLSTIQIGITLIGVLSGAVGGATLSKSLAQYFVNAGYFQGYANSVAFIIIVSVISYFSLVLGELVPKRVGMTRSEQVALLTSVPTRTFSVLASPLVKLLSYSTKLVLRIFGLQAQDQDPVTEEEIRHLLREGTAYGLFEEVEQELVERVLSLDDRPVSSIMTPVGRVIWLDIDDPIEINRKKMMDTGYSKYPVVSGTINNILGIAEMKNISLFISQENAFTSEHLRRNVLYVPRAMPVLNVLKEFKQTGNSLAIVVDEYGSVEGVVSLADVMEAIVGDLPLMGEETGYLHRPDGSWLVDGMLPIDDLYNNIDRSLPTAKEGVYDTVAGFVLHMLKRIPKEGDRFIWRDWEFEVVDMDAYRVDKIILRQFRNE